MLIVPRGLPLNPLLSLEYSEGTRLVFLSVKRVNGPSYQMRVVPQMMVQLAMHIIVRYMGPELNPMIRSWLDGHLLCLLGPARVSSIRVGDGLPATIGSPDNALSVAKPLLRSFASTARLRTSPEYNEGYLSGLSFCQKRVKGPSYETGTMM